MAEELHAPPPVPTFLDEKTAVERIQAIVGNARTVWFALIAFLAFIGLTLTSVRDLDFFSATATTQLPIVNIAIPTTTFFWSAAWLAAVLHTYFHFYLLKLWDVLAEAPPEIGGAPLGDRVFPWLVVDWALRQRPDRPTTPRPMDGLANAVTWLVIWLASPLLLAAFWWRSMPAHDARLTLAIGAALLLGLFATLCGWRRAHQRLGNPGLGDTRPFWRRRGRLGGLDRRIDSLGVLALWLGRLTALPVVFLASLAGAGWHHLPEVVDRHGQARWPGSWRQPPLAYANLINAEIVERPPDWVGRDTAERRFRITWCRDRQIPADACERPTEPYQSAARQTWCGERPIEDCAAAFRRFEAAFDEEWQEQRREYLANLAKPDLSGRDLRGADASGAFLVGIDLREARLEGARLSWARLEGADLRGARLEGAILGGTRLEGTSLAGTRLEGIYLGDARLEWADLRGAYIERVRLYRARLEGANLARAWLNGVNLRDARLEPADLSRARLVGANLLAARLQSAEWAGASFSASLAHAADFTAGRNLTQSQLAEVIGDEDTILPLDAETGEQLYVWTCWARPPQTLDILLSLYDEMLHAHARSEWICSENEEPERTGRPADPAPVAPGAD